MIRLNPVTITLFAIVLGSFAFISGISFLDIMELKTIDLRFAARGKVSPGSEVVMAVIDEKSLDKEGKWVWPRSKLADLVTKLSKAGARVVALDIGFLEPDDKRIVQTINSIKQEVKKSRIQNTKFEHFLENLEYKSDNDRLLADAIINSSSRVVLGYFFHMSLAESGHLNEADIQIHQENIRTAHRSGNRA